MEYLEFFKLAAPLMAIGGAWGGAKVALNGSRERIKELKARQDDTDVRLRGHGESLVRIETKLDTLIERK